VRAGPFIAATTLVVSILTTTGVGAQKPDLSTKALVALATKYVDAYQREFAFLVAEERYRQESQEKGWQPQSQVARGEMFLTWLEAEQTWTVVHDISDVDGEPVADHESVRTLLQNPTASLQSIGRRVADLNARYNIGHIRRNFNDPMIALQVFHARYRDNMRFDVGPLESGADGTLVTLRFRERDRSTIVHGMDGTPFPAKGEIRMDATTGVIRHAGFAIDRQGLTAELKTTFEREERLGLWVPVLFNERYTGHGWPGPEVTTCTSQYSNYRRFEVKGRIKDGIGTAGTTGTTGTDSDARVAK
jgi:hypothetical protein